MIRTGRREPRLLTATASLPNGQPAVRLEDGRALVTSRGAVGDGSIDRSSWSSTRATPATVREPRSTSTASPTGELAGSGRLVPRRELGASRWSRPRHSPATRRHRVRVNLILDGADAELDEEQLVGHDVTIGSVGLHVVEQIDRLHQVARARPGIAANVDVLKRLIRERNNLMGVSAGLPRQERCRSATRSSPLAGLTVRRVTAAHVTTM